MFDDKKKAFGPGVTKTAPLKPAIGDIRPSNSWRGWQSIFRNSTRGKALSQTQLWNVPTFCLVWKSSTTPPLSRRTGQDHRLPYLQQSSGKGWHSTRSYQGRKADRSPSPSTRASDTALRREDCAPRQLSRNLPPQHCWEGFRLHSAK